VKPILSNQTTYHYADNQTSVWHRDSALAACTSKQGAANFCPRMRHTHPGRWVSERCNAQPAHRYFDMPKAKRSSIFPGIEAAIAEHERLMHRQAAKVFRFNYRPQPKPTSHSKVRYPLFSVLHPWFTARDAEMTAEHYARDACRVPSRAPEQEPPVLAEKTLGRAAFEVLALDERLRVYGIGTDCTPGQRSVIRTTLRDAALAGAREEREACARVAESTPVGACVAARIRGRR
jgi:hypothetical protein